MATIHTRCTPLSPDCGLPAFTFAGFTWPRYVARLERGSLAHRYAKRATRATCGEYYHAPTPNNRSGIGFYLGSDSSFSLRWEWADKTDGARIRHKGWFCDDSQDQTIRGIVLRLPHGRGFLAGWSMGEGMASSVDFSPIFADAAGAALCADSMAENAAESEREYQANEQGADE